MSTARKVLLVDDDEDLRTSLKDQLVLHDEFEVSEAATASKGMEAAKTGRFDLVVFDVGLPDMDGREAVKLLRKSGFKTPIVMLTGNTSDADQILGLDAGANDYVLKPSSSRSCWRAFALSSASTSRARTLSSRSAVTPSSPHRNCWSIRPAARSG